MKVAEHYTFSGTTVELSDQTLLYDSRKNILKSAPSLNET